MAWYLHPMSFAESQWQLHPPIELSKGVYSIGRDRDCSIPLPECEVVSRRHAEIAIGRNSIKLRDLGSENGTFVRGRRLRKPCKLNDERQRFYLGDPDRNGIAFILSSERLNNNSDLTHVVPSRGGYRQHLKEVFIHAEGHAGVAIGLDNVRVNQPQPQPFSRGLAGRSGDVRYRETKVKIGTGGFGQLRLYRDTEQNQWVAGKVVGGSVDSDKNRQRLERERLEREARLLAQANHPHIVKYWDLASDVDEHVLMMEFLNGRTLRDYLRLHANCPLRYGIQWLIEIADALLHLHNLACADDDSGICHRDVQPNNIMIVESRKSVLIDFGLASAGTYSSIVGKGMPGFIAPEMLTRDEILKGIVDERLREQRRREIDHSCDVYGIGAVGYFILSGRPPYEVGEYVAIRFLPMQNAVKEGIEAQFTDADQGDPYLQRVFLDQIRLDAQQRPSIEVFKERLQLWWLFVKLREQGTAVPEWQQLADAVLREKSLDLTRLPDNARLQPLLARALIDDPPPLWEGTVTNFTDLSVEGKMRAEIFWISDPHLNRGEVLLEIAPEVAWSETILARAQAVCSAGENLDGLEIPEPDENANTVWRYYTQGTRAEQRDDLTAARDCYREAFDHSSRQYTWIALVLSRIENRLDAAGIAQQRQFAEQLRDILSQWPQQAR